MNSIQITEGIIVAVFSGIVGFLASWLNYRKGREQDKLDNKKAMEESVAKMYIALCESQQERIKIITLSMEKQEAVNDAKYAALEAKYVALQERYDNMKIKYEGEIEALRKRIAELEYTNRGGC